MDSKQTAESAADAAGMPAAGIVLATLAAMVLANLVDFPADERRAPWRSAGQRFSTSQLTALGRKHASISIMSSPYLMVAETAPAARIILPEGHPFSVENLYGLARATEVVIRAFPANEMTTSSDLSTLIIDSQHDGNAGQPWTLSIASAIQNPKLLVAIERAGNWYLVDSNLLTDKARQAAGL